MKLTWKNNNNKSSKKRPVPTTSNLRNLPFDFDQQQNQDQTSPTTTSTNTSTQLNEELASIDSSDSSNTKQLALSFQAQGDKLAEDGKYREALGKWEAALTLIPENAVLHEQKAQVLLEIGDSWNALKAATRAAELEPSWAEVAMRTMKVLADAVSDAWITLGRAQLNFGEPDSAIESFDKALAIKPNSEEAQDDRHTASHLIKRRKQLHSAGLSTSQNRYAVSDETKSS